jgi:hypothetical protein
MRYFDFTVTPEDGAFHPVDRTIAETPTISRETLVHVNALGNNNRLQGDPEALTARLDDHPDVISYAPVDVTDKSFHLYVHIRPGRESRNHRRTSDLAW